MKRWKVLLAAAALSAFAGHSMAQDAGGYKVIKTDRVGGPGGMDYITIDPDMHKLFVPRADHMVVYDADSLAKLGEVDGINGTHGVAIDPKNHHGFISGRGQNGGAITVFDTETYATVATINVSGNPDGIMIDKDAERVYVGSHRAPSITVINAADNSVIGTIDNLGVSGTGNVEGCASDGKHLYCNLESDSQVAVVDEATLKVTDHWSLGDGEGPTGIGLDVKNHRLFSMCGGNGRVVCINTDDGKIVKSIPCGARADSGGFNSTTLEAFSANGSDGTLTVVKENTPDDIVLEGNVKTMPQTRSCTVDSKNGRVYLATYDYTMATTQPAPAATPAPAAGGGGARRGGGRASAPPDSFTLIIVGKP